MPATHLSLLLKVRWECSVLINELELVPGPDDREWSRVVESSDVTTGRSIKGTHPPPHILATKHRRQTDPDTRDDAKLNRALIIIYFWTQNTIQDYPEWSGVTKKSQPLDSIKIFHIKLIYCQAKVQVQVQSQVQESKVKSKSPKSSPKS